MSKSSFLYQEIFQQIKRSIEAGDYIPGDILPSEREICLQFNVERGTVRRAMDLLIKSDFAEKLPGIGTRVKGRSIVDEHAHSDMWIKKIGFIMADDPTNPRKLSQPFYSDLFYHLDQDCRKNNLQLIYASVSPDDDISSFLSDSGFSFIIFTSCTPNSWIEYTYKSDIPTIMVNDQSTDLTTVSCDHCDGALQATNYLIENGHQRIAIITGPENSYTSKAKLAGCYQALISHNIEVPQLKFAVGTWEYQSGYNCAKTIFSNTTHYNRPTALFAFNDAMCIGALQAMSDMSLSVPGDVSVIGFDNMEQLAYIRPDLSTVDANVAAFSQVIIQYALSPAFFRSNLGLTILVPAFLVPRNTVRSIK